MRKLAAVLFIGAVLFLTGLSTMQVAGDVGPDGNGSNPIAVQMAGDVGPDGNG